MHARPTPHVKRHPIRGALFGLGTGVGVALILIDRAVVALGTMAPYIVVLGFVIIGILYGTLAPAKGPREPEPTDMDDASEAPEAAAPADASASAAPTASGSPLPASAGAGDDIPAEGEPTT